jgi:hypothetical protein
MGPASTATAPASVDAGTAAVLDLADRLEAAGLVDEAIEVLTDRNRRHPDGDVELRLVALRHRAYATLDRRPGRSEWPPAVPDPFPDCDGVPEVGRDDLTVEALAGGIVHHGCLLVRGLVPPETAARLRESIDLALDGYDRRAEGAPLTETRPWFSAFQPDPGYPSLGFFKRAWVRKGNSVWTADSPRALFEVVDALEAAGIREVVTGYLGERPAVAVDKWTLRCTEPGGGEGGWHQDGAFLGQGLRTVNVWLTLTRCGDDAPSLDLVPRRIDHIVPTGTAGSTFDWAVAPDVVAQVAGGTPVLRPRFEEGDALLFDDLFLHRTGRNLEMTQRRYAVESWFFAPSAYPDDQVPLVF